MKRYVLKATWPFLLVAMTGAAPVLAWGDTGHKVVCGIAYQLLDDDRQAEVDRLVKVYRAPDGSSIRTFTDSCKYADRARNESRKKHPGKWRYFAKFSDWHFLNLPRDADEVLAEFCGANCVLTGIEYHSARLSQPGLEEWKRSEALFFLGHWVGDIHQPLHVSFADDLGGNEIKPIVGGTFQSTHLHGVWDTGIVSTAIAAAHHRST